VEECPDLGAVSVKLNEHWLKPDWDWVKINTDGAYRASDAYGGGDVVIRNHHGSFVGGASHFFLTFWTLKELSYKHVGWVFNLL
jgi:hypothetical protein